MIEGGGAVMAVTPDDVAKTLGRSAPDSQSDEYAQWETWIADVLVLVKARYRDRFGQLAEETLDLAVREVVAERVRRPDSATSYSVSVDDGTVTRRYENGDRNGLADLLDAWWPLLDPTSPHGEPAGAFTINPFRPRGRCW